MDRKLKYNRGVVADKKVKIFIEALPLTTTKISGIGYMLKSLVIELASNKAAKDYEVVLFVPKGAAKLVRQHDFTGIAIAELPLHQRFVTWFNFLGILPPVDRWLGPGVYLFGNYTNYPISKKSYSMTFFYDLCFKRYPELVEPKVRAVLRKFAPTWLARTDLVLTASDFSKKEIAKFFPASSKKISVIPGGVDGGVFYKRRQNETESLRKKYGLPKDYLLFLSNIEPRKNLERLVNAYARLTPETRDKHPLVLVGGDGWLNKPIHDAITAARAQGCSIVQPKEYVVDEDLPALHSGAVALLQPSIYEGFGLSPLQAMACGTPVLSSKTASLPEVTGKAAVYVDPYNVEDIRDKLEQLLTDNDLRTELIRLGISRAKQFGWSKSTDDLLRLIKTARIPEL